MPCRCSGVKVDKCECGLFGTRPQFRRSEQTGMVLVSPVHSHGKLTGEKNSLFVLIVERLYEKCAAYNLRYCPFRDFVRNKDYLSNALKDLIILCCFLLANFVVFMTIITRMTIQLGCLVVQSAKWMRRVAAAKSLICIRPTTTPLLQRYEVDFTPPHNEH